MMEGILGTSWRLSWRLLGRARQPAGPRVVRGGRLQERLVPARELRQRRAMPGHSPALSQGA